MMKLSPFWIVWPLAMFAIALVPERWLDATGIIGVLAIFVAALYELNADEKRGWR